MKLNLNGAIPDQFTAGQIPKEIKFVDCMICRAETFKAVAACVVPTGGMLFFQSQLSFVHFDLSGRGHFSIPMSIYSWIGSGILILVSAILSAYGFKGTSWVDKIFSSIGAVITLIFIRIYFISLLIEMHG